VRGFGTFLAAVAFAAAMACAHGAAAQKELVYAPPPPPPTSIPNLPCATPQDLEALKAIQIKWSLAYSTFQTDETAMKDAQATYEKVDAAYQAAVAAGADPETLKAFEPQLYQARFEWVGDMGEVSRDLKDIAQESVAWHDLLGKISKQCVQPKPPVRDVPPPVHGNGRTRNASTWELAVLDEINKARTNPQGYATSLCSAGSAEGRADAVAFLMQQKPLPALTWDARLGVAAGEHAADDGARGNAEHVGSDGSKPITRAQALGVHAMVYAEVISIAQKSPCDVVGQLVIDRPGPAHPHRADLFDAMLVNAGVGCGDNAKYGTMCVVDMSGDDVGGGDGD
jgi:uncharacterized protein YkwD